MTDTHHPPLSSNLLDQIHIREAVHTDLTEMEWEGEYQRFRGIYADVFARTNRGLAIMWVAEHYQQGLAGQAFIQLKMSDRSCANGRTRAYLHSFRVRAEYRRQGLGSFIMGHAESDLAKRGFKELTLNVARDNPGGIRLYKRLGYRILKEIPGRWSYYDDQGLLQHVSEPGYRLIKELSTI